MERKEVTPLRPRIPKIEEGKAYSPSEQFQNQVLRPILKYQNDLLVKAFRHYVARYNVDIPYANEERLKSFIDTRIKKDIQLRATLSGMILGLMTLDEFEYYRQHERELNKRMISMCADRLLDQITRSNQANLKKEKT